MCKVTSPIKNIVQVILGLRHNAVSYTHLDVYKRQPLNALRKKGVKFEWTPQHQTAFEKLKESIISPPGITTVSYTHLDVYKRQQPV